jgi:hypothetical protein
MKKPNHSGNIHNSALSIKTKLSDTMMLLCLVEMLADRRNDIGYSSQKVPEGWQAIETSSIEAFVNGNATLSHKTGDTKTNFTSSFLFTCSKVKGKDYSFNWLNSLS